MNVGDARHKELRYRLFLRDATGRALTYHVLLPSAAIERAAAEIGEFLA